MDLPIWLENAEVTTDLYASLSTYSPLQQQSAFIMDLSYAFRLLNAIQKLVRLRLWLFAQLQGKLTLFPVQDFGDSGNLYNNMRHRIVYFLETEFPNDGALHWVQHCTI